MLIGKMQSPKFAILTVKIFFKLIIGIKATKIIAVKDNIIFVLESIIDILVLNSSGFGF